MELATNLNLSAEMKKFRSELINEHNRLRTDPQAYIPFIENQIKFIKNSNNNKFLCLPGQKPILLKDGILGYTNAIEFLKNQIPVKTLTFDENIFKSSQEFAVYIGENGLVSGVDKDGLNVGQRIEKYCEWEDACAENIEFGFKTARDFIISLLIDDGLVNKKHREILFDNKLKYFGLGVHSHTKYENVVVVDYVGGVRPKGSFYFDFEENTVLSDKILESLENKIKSKNIKSFKSYESSEYRPEVQTDTYPTNDELNQVRNRQVIKNVYDLKDGTQHIVEIESII